MQHVLNRTNSIIRGLLQTIRTDIALQNSLFLITSTGVMAVSGFVFWYISAKLYTPEQIGLASTLMAASTTLALFSLLGLDNVLVRYLPSSRKPNRVINTAVAVTGSVSVALAVVFLALLSLISPSLNGLMSNPLHQLFFILGMVLVTVNRLMDNTFIGFRTTKYVLLANIGLAIAKIILPVALVLYGAFGLFFAYVLSLALATILGLYYLMRHFNYRPHPVINTQTLREVRKFSAGTYSSNVVAALPLMTLPIIITNALGAEHAAFFNLAWTFAAMVFIVPSSTGSSLLAEVALDPVSFRRQTYRTTKQTLFIMLPLAVALYLFSYQLLAVFGDSFAVGAQNTLQILMLATIALALNTIAQTILKLHHKMARLFSIQLAGTIAMVALCWPLAKAYGATGGAYAFLTGQVIMTLLHLVFTSPLLRKPIPEQQS